MVVAFDLPASGKWVWRFVGGRFACLVNNHAPKPTTTGNSSMAISSKPPA
jgi:hypothetical protein